MQLKNSCDKVFHMVDIVKQLIDKKETLKPPKPGQIVQGEVVNIGRAAIYLNLGPWGIGIIYGREFYSAKDSLRNLNIGDEVSAKIVGLENEEGYIELSMSKADKELAWKDLKKIKDDDEIIEVKIQGANKGGLLTKVSGVQAFIPVSQLSPDHYPKVEGGDSQKILLKLQELIGELIKVKIFSLDLKEENLILSEKAKEREKTKELLKNYKEGDIVKGEITGVVDFGAFIKFGKEELEGLIHISELDWQLIEDPSEIVKPGDKVKAKIADISDDGRVSLSLKALKEDPWKGIEEKFQKGQVIEGKVTKFNPFGTFVQVTPEIQGLCHVSEFGSVDKMKDILKEEGSYKFEILSIEPKEHRMTLSPKKE